MTAATEKLVGDLLKMPTSRYRDEMLERAKVETYHDFHCPADDAWPCPKIRLIVECRDAVRALSRGFGDDALACVLAFRKLEESVIHGEYDDRPCPEGICKKCDELAAQMRAMGLG